MTIKEAILKSLDDIGTLASSTTIFSHIQDNAYHNFGAAKTPAASISAELSRLINDGDSRVKRIKQKNGAGYDYYLKQYEANIGVDVLTGEAVVVAAADDTSAATAPANKKGKTTKTYRERDLHKLLSSFLKSEATFSKTIFHEESNGKDNNQIWTHPDMVGVKFLHIKTKASQDFLKSVNRLDMFKISAYELKREINNDNELKKAFFQAVSNSSWANYAYLVAFEFSDGLRDEIARLSQSFGIGIIQLNANPYQSKVLHAAQLRELDFRTIDKLCSMNEKFAAFISDVEAIIIADERYVSGSIAELASSCDKYFENDSEMYAYCREHHIPIEDELADEATAEATATTA